MPPTARALTGLALGVALLLSGVATGGPSVDDVDTAASVSAVDPPRTDRSVRSVSTERALRAAWADPRRTRIDLAADLVLRDCHLGDPIRESPYPMLLHGHGHTIRQSCFEKRVLRQDGTGWLDIRDVTLTRGGSDGPGAALTSRGEIMLSDCAIEQNLAEEPGGGVFSMRRVTVHRCSITGNLANDDGGGIYARRGGVQVYDSILSTNLVDGSGGAIGSTGDILVVRSKVDGNTTDGDGGALYADEDGDVVVVHSLIDGSDADGPGGAIFTLDGDVAVYDSTLIGNRADDRGGAIAGEADVVVVSSTIARNLAIAHAGGGVWSRGDLLLVNSTVSNNYAEGEGGGVLAAGRAYLVYTTMTRNIAPVGGDVGAAGVLHSFASILGPPVTQGVTGDTIPTRRACRVYRGVSAGYNFGNDTSCGLLDATDLVGDDPLLAQLEDDPNGFVLAPLPDSPVRARIPSGSCLPELPDPLPAAQLLERWVEWGDVLTHDAVGTPRDAGAACDIGAVQSTPDAGAAPGPVPRGHVGPYRRLGPFPPEADPVYGPVSAPRTPRRSGPAPRWVGGAGAHSPGGAAARPGSAVQLASRPCWDARAGSGCRSSGDVRHRWGYLYDERDGTGHDLRPALTRDRTRPQWSLLRLATTRPCLSAAPDPNGAGDDARAAPRPLVQLLRQLRRLDRRARLVELRTERFDDWESCLTWLPVTEVGDVEQRLGYLRAEGRGPAAALEIDRSEWDDPDYQLLAFRAGDRPFGPTGSAAPIRASPPTGRRCGRRLGAGRRGRTSARGSATSGRTSRTWASRSTRSPASTSASTPSGSPRATGTATARHAARAASRRRSPSTCAERGSPP